MTDPDRRARMSAAAKTLARPDAAAADCGSLGTLVEQS